MKKLSFLLGALLVFLLANPLLALGQTKYPEPVGYVNDFAGILPPGLEQSLEAELRDYEAKTTNEIAVVTVSSLGGLSVEDYTIGLAEQWKVGKKGKDNGVIILVAPNERAVRIEVGYGLEPVLTDSKAGSVVNKMIPFFKEGKYDAGIVVGVRGVIGAIGYLTPEEIEQQKKQKEERNRATATTVRNVVIGIGAAGALLMLILILCNRISAWRKEEKRKESVRKETLDDIKWVEDDLWQIASEIKRLPGGGL